MASVKPKNPQSHANSHIVQRQIVQFHNAENSRAFIQECQTQQQDFEEIL